MCKRNPLLPIYVYVFIIVSKGTPSSLHIRTCIHKCVKRNPLLPIYVYVFINVSKGTPLLPAYTYMYSEMCQKEPPLRHIRICTQKYVWEVNVSTEEINVSEEKRRRCSVNRRPPRGNPRARSKSLNNLCYKGIHGI